MASTKEGYQEEFKSFTLALALVVVLPSTSLGAFSGFLSALGDSLLSFLALLRNVYRPCVLDRDND